MRLFVILTLLFSATRMEAQDVSSSFGHRQLAQLLDDRPSMKGILPPDDTICRWVVHKFNSGDFGKRVYWDHQNPLSGREAENSPSQNGAPAFIRITDAKHVSGRDKWCMLVFEFENLENARDFRELQDLALAGKISRETFSKCCVELEWKAVLRTKRYFKRHPILGATALNAPEYTKFIGVQDDLGGYFAWLDSLQEHEYDPREYFAKWFDQCNAYTDAYGPYTEQDHGMQQSGGGAFFREMKSTPAAR